MIDATNRNTALASAFVEELARCGVEQAVISPGSRSTPLAVALYRRREINTSVVIDERCAGFLALGAAQASGRPVVLLCTSGTAAANYHPAVAEADLSAVPLVVLTADRPPELRDIGAGQTIDQLKLYGAAVRWFREVGTHAADDEGLLHLRATACRAFATAAGDPRPGPVHLNFAWREPLAPAAVAGQVTASSPLALNGRDGEPLTRVEPLPETPAEAVVASVAEAIAKHPRGLILAGRQTDPGLRGPLTELAAAAGYPILAEPTSQLRAGPHDLGNLIWAYDEILARPDRSLAPGLVLRFGEQPTSKRLRLWLAGMTDARQVVVPGPYAWNEPTRIAARILRGGLAATAAALAAAVKGRFERGEDSPAGGPAAADPEAGGDERSVYRDGWRRAQREAAAAQMGRLAASAGIDSGTLHHNLAGCYRDGEIVYTNSSMAIRDQETWLVPSGADVLMLANRGANGIDGLISSGIGAAIATGRPTTIITGDVALLHDLGALASWHLAPGPLRIVVVNDGGGTIFNRLPQQEAMPPTEFAALMTTPPGIEPERAAALFGLPYTRLTEIDALPAALAGGSALIEVPVEVPVEPSA